MRLAELWIYPIKSMGGIALNAAAMEARGLRHDRRWLLVRPDGSFLSQRDVPAMATIRPALTGDALRVSAPGSRPLDIPLAPPRTTPRQVQIWRSFCDALPVGPAADAWFSDVLALPCQLVFMPETTRREVNPAYTAGEGIVSFADAYPCLLTTSASLADLNSRLPVPLPMNRFRPNLVVAGSPPWDEDEWRTVRVGSVSCQVAKDCDRCVVTTIDQATGRPDGDQLLREMAKFRRTSQGVIMGRYLIPLGDGTLQIGDPVTVDRR